MTKRSKAEELLRRTIGQTLPMQPDQRLKTSSAKTEWDPNAPETEEDSHGYLALRALKVRQQAETSRARSQTSSQSQTNTPQKTASPSDDKPPK